MLSRAPPWGTCLSGGLPSRINKARGGTAPSLRVLPNCDHARSSVPDPDRQWWVEDHGGGESTSQPDSACVAKQDRQIIHWKSDRHQQRFEVLLKQLGTAAAAHTTRCSNPMGFSSNSADKSAPVGTNDHQAPGSNPPIAWDPPLRCGPDCGDPR